MTMSAPAVITERQLLQAITADDQQAFHQLVDRHWARVYYNTLRLVRSADTAQEITQDIFLKIWEQRAQLNEVRNFSGYLSVVGRNLVISSMRKRIESTVAIPDYDLPAQHGTPDQQLQTKETQRLVMSGISCLPPQQQLAFTLSRLEGLSHDAIANRLGLSRHTVKGHIVLALNFLRSYIRQHQ